MVRAITDEHFNNMVIAPSIDAIEEFNIEKTSYAPEFGGKSGAVNLDGKTLNGRGLIVVLWEGRKVMMFTDDLRLRAVPE
jgi:hypothetical protein